MQYVVLRKMEDRIFWQNCGRASPRLETSHPAVQEVSGGEMRRLSREVVRELRDLERRRSQEVEENRARRRSMLASRRPGSHCPAWLLLLLESSVS